MAPDTVAELLTIGAEACEVAERIGDSERLVYAHFHRFLAYMFLGDVEQAEGELAASGRIAEELRQPALSWFVVSPLAMVAIGQGRLGEGETLSSEALAFGERAVRDLAVVAHRFQHYTLCDFRGRLDEVDPTINDWAAEYPNRPFRELLAHLRARRGQIEEAEKVFKDLATDDFSAVPFDFEWLVRMSLLTETCIVLSDRTSARSLYRALAPYAALSVADPPEAIRGSVSRYLGLLAALLERFDDAGRHFEHALEVNEQMGARPWLALTQEDYGRLLLAQGDEERGRMLIEQALSTYRELGMEGPLRQALAASR